MGLDGSKRPRRSALYPRSGAETTEKPRGCTCLSCVTLRHPVSPWLRTQPPRKLRTCKIKIQYSVGP